MDLLSSQFLVDKWLKYMGWMLHDKAATVRLATLQQLHKLYLQREKFPMLKNVTTRFKTRLTDMVFDVDDRVVVETLHILIRLLSYDIKTTSSDVETLSIYQMINHANGKIAKVHNNSIYFHTYIHAYIHLYIHAYIN